jgi:hypothetical protein
MGDTNFRDLGGGLSAAAQGLGGIMSGQKAAEDKQRAQLNDSLNKQKTFNEVAQVAIQAAKLKSEMLQLDPNFDVSQIDLLRQQLTSGGLGADQMNAQAQAPGMQQINMLGGNAPTQGLPSQPNIAPQYDPTGINLQGYHPLSKAKELQLQHPNTQDRSVQNQMNMFELRDFSSNLKTSKAQLQSAIKQKLGQQFGSELKVFSQQAFEAVQKSGDENLMSLYKNYQDQLQYGMEKPHLRGVVESANPGFAKEWQKMQEYQASPEKQLKDYQQSPEPDQPTETPPPESRNFQPILEMANQYALGAKVRGMPDFYSDKALSDKLGQLVKAGTLTPADAKKIVSEASKLNHQHETESIKQKEIQSMQDQQDAANKRDANRYKTRAQLTPKTALNGR